MHRAGRVKKSLLNQQILPYMFLQTLKHVIQMMLEQTDLKVSINCEKAHPWFKQTESSTGVVLQKKVFLETSKNSREDNYPRVSFLI